MPGIDKDQVVAVLNRFSSRSWRASCATRTTRSSFSASGASRSSPGCAGRPTSRCCTPQQVGEWITTLGAYPSLAIGPLLDSHKHDIARSCGSRSRPKAGAGALPRPARRGRRPLGRARGVRSPDDPGSRSCTRPRSTRCCASRATSRRSRRRRSSGRQSVRVGGDRAASAAAARSLLVNGCNAAVAVVRLALIDHCFRPQSGARRARVRF